MDLGLGLWTLRSTAALPGGFARMHADLVDDARYVEARGFHSLWLAEHHFWYDGWTPAPLTLAGAAIAATTTVHIGTGIHLLPLGDPVIAAQEVESLHRLSGGRFEYGVGIGYRPAEYDGFGLSRRVRGRRMDAALDLLIERWGDDRPTIWVGGFAEAAIERTASRGLAAFLPSTLRPHQVARAIERFREASGAAGVAPGRMGILKYGWVADAAEDRARAAATHASITREYTGAWFPLQGRPGFESPELVDAQVARAIDTALIGTPEEVVGELRELAEAGVDLVVLHLMGDARAPRTRETIDLIAERVLPHTAGRVA